MGSNAALPGVRCGVDMTQAERDRLLERLAVGMVEHSEASVENHADLQIRLNEIQTAINHIQRAQEATWGAAVHRLIERSTATIPGTVALLALIAILALTAAAVVLGDDKVLSILAGQVRIGLSETETHTPVETP